MQNPAHLPPEYPSEPPTSLPPMPGLSHCPPPLVTALPQPASRPPVLCICSPPSQPEGLYQTKPRTCHQPHHPQCIMSPMAPHCPWRKSCPQTQHTEASVSSLLVMAVPPAAGPSLLVPTVALCCHRVSWPHSSFRCLLGITSCRSLLGPPSPSSSGLP